MEKKEAKAKHCFFSLIKKGADIKLQDLNGQTVLIR